MRPLHEFARALALCSSASLLVAAVDAPTASAQPSGPPPSSRASARPAASSTPAAAAPAPGSKEARQAEARARFLKGVKLFHDGALGPALAEFLASRELFPTRSATENAAVCLKRLGRFDEALDYYEALLREFPDLPDTTKASAQRAVMDLRALVGSIEVEGAEPGAALVIDGRSRGELPSLEPVRVPAGSHVVRVYKEGFEPFETRVDVAGGATVRTKAKLRALRVDESGRLRVVERSGRSLEVIVGGVVVGKTPWEGPLPTGPHTVQLRGEGILGTQPAVVPVRLRETTQLSLEAEELAAALRIEPTPPGASVIIDSVPLGRGTWEGRLRAGPHKVEVVAEGFVAVMKDVRLEKGQREVLAFGLERDPSSELWKKPARFSVEVVGGFLMAPTFGGPIAAGTGPGVSRSLGVGGFGALRGGYTLGSGFGFGITAGFVGARQKVEGREALVRAATQVPAATVNDALAIRGVTAGAWAGLSLGERFPVHLRLGAGALIGSAGDARTFDPSEVVTLEAGSSGGATFFLISPEVRAALPLGRHWEISAGLEAMVLIGLSTPKWSSTLEVELAGDRLGRFDPEEMVGRVLVLIAPGLGARFIF